MEERKMITLVILLTVIVIIGFCTIRIVPTDEMGLKVFLGRPIIKRDSRGNLIIADSGPRLQFWPFIKIVTFPKEFMKFSFSVKSIMTKRGRVRGYDEIVEPAEIDISCTLLARFDRNRLDSAIQRAPGKNAKTLGPYLVPYVRDTIRALGGRVPWRLINQERYHATNWILGRIVPTEQGCPQIHPQSEEEIELQKKKEVPTFYFDAGPNHCVKFTADQLKESPFIQFSLTDLSLAIENIDITNKELQTAISEPERERIKATAKQLAAEGEKTKRQKEGEGDAHARKVMLEVIKDYPELEYLFSFREAAKGTSNTIFYQIPSALEERIKGMTSGNKISEILVKLKPEQRKLVERTIIQAVENLKK